LLLTSGLLIGSAVLIVRGRPEPSMGKPLDFTIKIPERAENVLDNRIGSGGSVKPGGVEKAVGKININTAAPKELKKLPGIGPVLADRIVEYREKVGPFSDKKDIIKVNGIGDRKYDAVEEYITVE
jgi:competence ComEA-like helix-hairpin-helix protein